MDEVIRFILEWFFRFRTGREEARILRLKSDQGGAGLLLSDVQVLLSRYAKAISGRNGAVREIYPASSGLGWTRRQKFPQWNHLHGLKNFTDRRDHHLPYRLSRFPDWRSNLDLARFMVAHQVIQKLQGSLDLTVPIHEIRWYPLGQDLYAHLENFRVERQVVHLLPGLQRSLSFLVQAAREDRPPLENLTPKEQAVELLIRDFLNVHPGHNLDPRVEEVVERFARDLDGLKSPSSDPTLSREIASKLIPLIFRLPGGYRSIPMVLHHGWIGPDLNLSDSFPVEAGVSPSPEDPRDSGEKKEEDQSQLDREYRVRSVGRESRKEKKRMLVDRFDRFRVFLGWLNIHRPVDGETGEKDEEFEKNVRDLDWLDLLRDGMDSRSSFRYKRKSYPTHPPARRPFAPVPPDLLLYDEWNYHTRSFLKNWCQLIEEETGEGTEAEVETILMRYRRELRLLKRRFGAFSPEYVHCKRQEQGEEIDLDSLVDAFSDRRAGAPADEKFYVARVRQKRDVAVGFLIDLSASTETFLGDRRIIDIEKEALLLMAEALTPLGDQYGIFGFSGRGRQNCQIFPIKRFSEPYTLSVKKRIVGIRPHLYTRMGPPIRHVTQLLGRVEAKTKFLIILSDGKPNDSDVYEGVYGIKDTRKAIQETQNRNIRTFCLTIDEKARDYLGSIFGKGNFRILTRVSRLPMALPEVYSHLTR